MFWGVFHGLKATEPPVILLRWGWFLIPQTLGVAQLAAAESEMNVLASTTMRS